MHNVGTIADMAFGNAFLGIVHAMSHTLGATFYEDHRAPERFQDVARALGLPAAHPPEGVESPAHVVERLRAARGQPTFQSLGAEERTLPMLDGMQEIMRAACFGPAEVTDE
ncbi:hypothetical protein ASD08_36990 [Streptomyces sp. Root369]|nr:hypothetical protein ASD08_36990 [Streptomyces sp. Root369]